MNKNISLVARIVIILLLVIFSLGASCKRENSIDENNTDGVKYVGLGELEEELYKYYMEVEANMRVNLNTNDQAKIDRVMQALIDGGEVEQPVRLDRSGKLPSFIKMKYVDFKKYYHSPARDTSTIYVIDSIALDPK